jgi:hypothetical protein
MKNAPTAQSPKTENTATKGDCKRQFDMGGRIGLENMVMEGEEEVGGTELFYY